MWCYERVWVMLSCFVISALYNHMLTVHQLVQELACKLLKSINMCCGWLWFLRLPGAIRVCAVCCLQEMAEREVVRAAASGNVWCSASHPEHVRPMLQVRLCGVYCLETCVLRVQHSTASRYAGLPQL